MRDLIAEYPIDLGEGVRAEVRELDGVVHGVAYVHPSPDGAPCEGWAPIKPRVEDGWDAVDITHEHLTLRPSLLCAACGHHGFIRDGRWIEA